MTQPSEKFLEAAKKNQFTPGKAAEVRAKQLANKRKEAEADAKSFHASNELAKLLAKHLVRSELADKAFAAAQKVVNDLLTGAIPVRTGSEAAAVVKAMVEVGRMEKGEANSALDGISREDLLRSVAAIRDAAQARMTVIEGGKGKQEA